MASFEYSRRVLMDDTLEIDDICNFTIKANDDLGNFYYLTGTTDEGWITLLECGPFSDIVDSSKPNYISWNYTRMPSDKRKISRIIEQFLNNPKRCITQAEVCEYEEIEDKITNPTDLLGGY